MTLENWYIAIKIGIRMIITSNNTIFLETQKEVWKIKIFHWRINKNISGVDEILSMLFFIVNSVDFCVYELT